MTAYFQLSRALFWTLIVFSCTPWCTPPLALALGLVFALTMAHPHRKQSSVVMKLLLQASVVGLGFGMDIYAVLRAGQTGFAFTVATILGTLALGMLLGRLLNVKQNVATLIAVGTAICGGSAIAAIAPVINANDEEISVSLATVFVLNSFALFIFPLVGTAFALSQQAFGLWAAIAIHDTSSVVGAAARFGAESLSLATTVKLSRALWILPLAFGFAFARRLRLRSENAKSAIDLRGVQNVPLAKVSIPHFIGLFLVASVVRTMTAAAPALEGVFQWFVMAAKTGLVVTLLLMGMGLSRQAIRSVGARPFVQGFVLWCIVSALTLWCVVKLL